MKDEAKIEKFLRVKPASITKEPQYVTYDYLPDVQCCFSKVKGSLIIQALDVESDAFFAQVKGKKWVYIGEEEECEEELMELLEGIKEDCNKIEQEIIYIVSDADGLELVD